MTVRIIFFGTGNAFADGGRSNACIHLAAPGVSLLLDCGGSALPAIKRAIDPATIGGIAVSHLHGDHFGAIPYLVIAEHYAGRDAPLTIGGPRGLPDRLRKAEASLYPEFFGRTQPRFAVREEVLGAREMELGGAMVSAFPVQHVPASEPHGIRVRAGGKVIAYSGDATWSDDLPPLAKGADLFICECTNFERDDPAHLSYRTLMRRRSELDCRRIVITHLGKETIDRLAEVELEHAEEGMVLEL